MASIKRRPGPCPPSDGLTVLFYAWHRMMDARCLMAIWHYPYGRAVGREGTEA